MNPIESILDATTVAALRAAEQGTCEMLAPEALCIEGISEWPTRELTQAQLDEIKQLLLNANSWHFTEFPGLPRDTLAFWLAGPAGEVAIAVCFSHSRWTVVGASGSRVGSFAPVREKLVALFQDVFRETAPWPNREFGQKTLAVVKVIQTAFKGVKLGDGIGLREANGHDDYASAEELKKLRDKDEKHDWAAISVDDLNRNWWGLAFFDAAGMRFHLPAFLIADLQGALTSCDLLFILTRDDPYTCSRFTLLDEAQRQAVREFLKLRLSDMNYAYQRPMIQAALAGYWAEPNERTE